MAPTLRSALLSLALLSALTTPTLAQVLTDLPNLSTATQGASPTTAANSRNSQNTQQTNTAAAASRSNTGDENNTQSTNAPSSQTQQTQQQTTEDAVTITGLPTPTTSDAIDPTAVHLTGLPTLSGVGPAALIVPDTSGAPFMQKSNMPEGTVFIAVGAVLGFLGFLVLAWRGLVAYSLHRSVQRAANAHLAADEKKGRDRKSGFGAYYYDSNLSLEHLARNKADTYTYASEQAGYYSDNPGENRPSRERRRSMRGGNADPESRRHSRHSRSENRPRNTHRRHESSKRASHAKGGANGPNASLFFSPTAAQNPMSNRSSTYLPAGYYAGGSAAPASGNPLTALGGLGGPPAAGYGRLESVGAPSPPLTPALPQNGQRSAPQSGYVTPRLSARTSMETFERTTPHRSGRERVERDRDPDTERERRSMAAERRTAMAAPVSSGREGYSARQSLNIPAEERRRVSGNSGRSERDRERGDNAGASGHAQSHGHRREDSEQRRREREKSERQMNAGARAPSQLLDNLFQHASAMDR